MLALVAAPAHEDKVELREVGDPVPAAGEALVAVRAISLNRGEVRMTQSASDGSRPGWDLAGEVLEPAGDGSGPKKGARVVGLVRNGAWAQRAVVSTKYLAELPPSVGFEEAAALPVAGLTALRALALGGLLLGKRVAVTGASGGVGRFAVQLAARSGAHVTALSSSPERARGLSELGASEVLTELSRDAAPYDLILESVGGASLATSLSRVAPNGTVVLYGSSSGEPTTFNANGFYPKGGARLYGLLLFQELERESSGTRDLGTLLALIATGRLDPQIDQRRSWREAAPAMRALLGRQIAGKVVLGID